MTQVEIKKLHSLTGHRDCIYTLAPSAVPEKFFSASGDGMIVTWDLNNPEEGHVVAKLPNSVYALHYHQALGQLIAGQNFEGIHLLDAENKKEIGSLQLTKGAIFDIKTFEHFAYIASAEGMIQKIDLTKLQIAATTSSVGKSARTIAIDKQLGHIIVGYSDNFIRVFDIDTLDMMYSWQAHANSVFTARLSPDGSQLITGSRDARLKFWSVNDQFKQSAEIVAHMYAINHLDFSDDNKHFVTCSLDKTVKVWDSKELKLLKVIDRARHDGHRTSVNKVLWTNHHNQLLSASDDRTIAVWHINFLN